MRQQLLGLAPQLALEASHAGQILHIGVPGARHHSVLNARQPLRVGGVQAGFQSQNKFHSQRITRFGARLHHRGPHFSQPLACQRGLALQRHQAGSSMHGHIRHGALTGIQGQPDFVQLVGFVGAIE